MTRSSPKATRKKAGTRETAKAGNKEIASGLAVAKRSSTVARDIARIAGVSTATVSRTFNHPERVADAVRARIESVAQSLGWTPNSTARALATRRSGVFGAVFPNLTFGDFPSAIQALQHELAKNSYTLIVSFSEYDLDQELRQVQIMLERGVEGLILVGLLHHEKLPELLGRYDIPVIYTFVFDPDAPQNCVGPDNHKVMYQLTRYLIELGHTRFGILGQSAKNNDRVLTRLMGVRDALAESSLAVHPNHYVQGHWGIREGKMLLRRVLAHAPQPTALVCGNGYLAIGAILECQRLGIRVPEDMSIVGYSDFEIMAELPIPITTVRVHGEDIGRRSAQILMARLSGTAKEPERECSAELLIRASSGPPREGPLPPLDLASVDDIDCNADETRPVNLT